MNKLFSSKSGRNSIKKTKWISTDFGPVECSDDRAAMAVDMFIDMFVEAETCLV